ncbi:hypothetical protein [Pantoea sp. BAV 3049]|uniref:hypothetical protein n=1 Tax=Pantoea sp. BAV 3049 TaxID=2654188 RepID=UPI00131DCF13|nr:hypothetical protein [Pantoea sp. BAV 3049]
MKIIMLSAGGVVLLAALAPDVALGAANCPGNAQQINDSNSLLLLGGTAKGPIKQVVVGEFGKDVDQQKRILSEFDRCGVLERADVTFDKNEGNMMLKMVQSIVRVTTGWEAVYDLSVFVIKEGQPFEVNRKQRTINFLVGKQGTITSSSDAFLLKGEKGFTETTNTYDSHLRLIKSVARGSDAQANGEYTYRWNRKNQLVSSHSGANKMTWTYDKNDREQRLLTMTHNDNSDLTSVDECQLWDEHDNCTLSYSHETEVFAKGEVRRNISAAYKFEYWDQGEGK